MYKTILLKSLFALKYFKWSLEYFYIRLFSCKSRNKRRNLELKDNSLNVVLVPHADDEIIGCYQVISRGNAQSLCLYYGFTGSNDSSENKVNRDREFDAFCEHQKIKYIHVSTGDNLLDILPNQHINLFFPSCVDWHEEHRRLSDIIHNTYANKRDNITFYWYSITVPIVCTEAAFLKENKNSLNHKYDIFYKYYVSQRHLPIKRFILQERINAIANGWYAAENYLEISYEDLTRAIRYCQKNEESINDLKYSINNIPKIRKKSYNIYRNIFRSFDE